MKKKLFVFIIVFILFIISLIIFLPNDIDNTLVTIDQGLSSWQISQVLVKEKIIKSPTIFWVVLFLSGQKNKIIADQYTFSGRLNYWHVAQIITKPQTLQREIEITTIEGWSNQEIADYLAAKKIVSAMDFLKALEKSYNYDFLPPVGDNYLQGYLFPDTYRIYANSTAEEIINKMLLNFQIKVVNQIDADLKLKSLSLAEVINLASIIEKEVSKDADRQIVADIFWRRLQDHYPLQSDATVNYITKKGTTQPSFDDTRLSSAYNTYQNTGLPPTPICNPSLSAIVAVLKPSANNYYFFLTTKEGQAIYSHNYTEHLQNKSKYLD